MDGIYARIHVCVFTSEEEEEEEEVWLWYIDILVLSRVVVGGYEWDTRRDTCSEEWLVALIGVCVCSRVIRFGGRL